MNDIAAAIRAEANARHAQYPQYAGAWDDWHLVTVTKRISSRGGVAFEKGEIALCKPTTRMDKIPVRGKSLPYDEWPEVEFATLYSRRNGVNTAVRVRDVRRVETPAV